MSCLSAVRSAGQNEPATAGGRIAPVILPLPSAALAASDALATLTVSICTPARAASRTSLFPRNISDSTITTTAYSMVAVQFLNEDKFAVSSSASRGRFRPLETSTCVSRGWSSAQSHIETASYQRHSAVFKRCLLGHQPLETEVDVPKTQNSPLEVQKHSN